MPNKKLILRCLTHAFLIAFAIAINLPFIWMILTSLKSKPEVFTYPPVWFPEILQWENYPAAWQAVPFGRFFINSIFVSSVVALGQLVFGSLAAYGFARLNFKGRDVLFFIFLGTMMIPDEVLLIPNYVLMRRMGWIDTYYALTVPFLTRAFVIFLLRQFFKTIPQELDDAARIDGCNHLTIFSRIILPLSKPALFTAGLFTFLGTWNDYLWPLVVTNSDKLRTVQVGLTMFQTTWQTEWTHLMAASTFVTLPIVLLFLLVQKQYIEGIAISGIKG